MRYDSLGCNGGQIARTPVLDRLANQGLRFTRAHGQSVVCMPARSTMVTGQHPSTHGVVMNGVPLPADAPCVARLLREQGFRTSLIGKAHFEPWLAGDGYPENDMAGRGEHGPHRGFEHMELASHFFYNHSHYCLWLKEHYPDDISKLYPIVGSDGKQNSQGGGDTSAVQVWHNKMPTEHYHTHWVGERSCNWLSEREEEESWFLWMSFPDPHHPWDPPEQELSRVNWRNLDTPPLWKKTHKERQALLAGKPGHWLESYEASRICNFEMPPGFVPADMTADQVREINAMNHIENELIDDACGRVLSYLQERGWEEETDVIFTTDHGELQGDFGLAFKGPYHVDALMHLPMIYRPAKSRQVAAAEIAAPVGQIDLAPTFCVAAGVKVPDWMHGQPLPLSATDADRQQRKAVLTEWDSIYMEDGFAAGPVDVANPPKGGLSIGMRSMYSEGWLITSYRPSSRYEGSEGELYDMSSDPQQLHNLWDDAGHSAIKSELLADLLDRQPPVREPLLDKVSNA